MISNLQQGNFLLSVIKKKQSNHNHCILIFTIIVSSFHYGQSEDMKILLWASDLLKWKQQKLPKEREITDDQVMIGYSFTSEWLREWCKFSGPITEQSKPKLKLSQITLDTDKNFSNSTLSIWKLWEERNMVLVLFVLIFNLSQKHNKNREFSYI